MSVLAKLPTKLYKAAWFGAARKMTYLSPARATRIYVAYLASQGVVFEGSPNYISTRVWIDSTDYALISIGNGVTISSFVRILTHDWAATTIARGLGHEIPTPIGRVLPVRIEDHCFIGTGSIVLPGAILGRCSIIGSGTVVRGEIPPFSIVVGSPAQVVGDSREYVERHFGDTFEDSASQ